MWDRAREMSKQENSAVDIRKEKGRNKTRERRRREKKEGRPEAYLKN